jgi:tRNA(Ile)-lysidine synthase
LGRALRDSGTLPEGSRVLAACSGGPDSTALLLGLAELAQAGRIELFAAHVHHAIRPGEADEDAEAVQELAESLDLRFELLRRDALEARRVRRRGLEEAARSVRRAALEEQAARWACDRIALAHTRDDQAETLLLHLLRGAGPDGLAAMRAESLPWVRPLLGTRRAFLREALSRAGLSWCSDRSNWSGSSARSLVRPLMQRAAELFNEALVDRLADTAKLLGEDADLLDGRAAEALAELRLPGTTDLRGGAPESRIRAGREGLSSHPPAIQRRVARRFLRELDPWDQPASADAVERLLRLASDNPGTERLAHVRGTVLRREGDELVAGGSAAPAPPPAPRSIELPGEWTWGAAGRLEARFSEGLPAAEGVVEDPTGRRVFFDGDRLPARLLLRCRRPGDRIRPRGAESERSLSAWMRGRGLSRPARERLPLLCDADADDHVLWVAGGTARHGLEADETTSRVLVLDWRPSSAGAEE